MNGNDDPGEARVHPREVRTALRRGALVDGFLCCRYSFSPYMACGHGCRYCDGRAEKYWVEGDFERDIVVRGNLPRLLGEEIPRLRERAVIGIGSGISDAYQPLERETGLTGRCAAILAEHRFPVTLLTKSSLVCRDAAAWREVNAGAGFILNLSIATLDDGVRRRFEPAASPIGERLETIRVFRELGIPVGVMAMPLLPFISDGEGELRALVDTLEEAGAAFVMPGGLTLRPGRQKDLFMATLEAGFPGLHPRYRELYAEERPSGAPLRRYQDELTARISAVMAGRTISFLLPHALYQGRLPLYDELHLLLLHMAELYAAKGVAVAGLKNATKRYADWLLCRKKVFNRRRSLNQAELEEETRELFTGGGAAALLGNGKLAGFLAAVAVQRRLFDYATLKLGEAAPPATPPGTPPGTARPS
jgi:DNA repair photolyase